MAGKQGRSRHPSSFKKGEPDFFFSHKRCKASVYSLPKRAPRTHSDAGCRPDHTVGPGARVAMDGYSFLLDDEEHVSISINGLHLPLFESNHLASSSSGRISDRTSADHKQHPPYPSTAILVAHTTPLASLAITPCGNLVATATVTGTLIHIWNAKSATLVREPRRGTDGAEIRGLRFRPDGLAICTTSDKGTIPVWTLAEKLLKF
ncbi:WD repeat domain phosphoinositide-interacting protein 3 [Puccinia graminis f. sp. tritici]|uniref:WD repeat domain phosphoinositide-interacting protein 3 n=1 Tax=Puccinia graminis f. sp. tritici TaxID=56615 RepID=A0A5B0P980_PUCGR|nr:WD repeat domain phosphoinositide-interacting protein 3 [Puccinia graminis f. sp. tritici]KAA1134009.1 WD repeat domain phosphoinositide-interacting protein 3 [Puccinia graminis f. sp. tritici]